MENSIAEIVLYNSLGCEIDRRKVDADESIFAAMTEALREWELNAGDTIKIIGRD